MHCKKTLTAGELIPLLSFLLQGGRCRGCNHKLSLQYPIVEFISGLIFVFVPLFFNYFYGISNSVFANFTAPRWHYGLILTWLITFLIWLIITFIDFRHYLIPNELNLILAVLGILITLVIFSHFQSLPAFHDSFLKHYAPLFSFSDNFLLSRTFGALLGGLFFGLLVFLSFGRGMGMGDVKLAFAAGLIFGWPDIGLNIILSFVFGGLFGISLVALKKKGMRDKVPFAPFFVIASAVTLFFGYQLLETYFHLFNL